MSTGNSKELKRGGGLNCWCTRRDLNPYGITTTSFTLAFVASKRARLPIPPRVPYFLYYNTRHCENGLSDSPNEHDTRRRREVLVGEGSETVVQSIINPGRCTCALFDSVLRLRLRDGLPSHVLRQISAAASEGHDVVGHASGARARRLAIRGTRMLALQIAPNGTIPLLWKT